MSERRYDVDWLRLLVMLAVFSSHCAQIFLSRDTWIVSNDQGSLVADVFCFWLEMWYMPLFFLLSGVGSWYALRPKSSRQYLFERTKRLLVPLYTVGLFILLPISNYFWIVTNREYQGTFWEMLPGYFARLGDFYPQPTGLVPVPFFAHMWFLQFLFLISLLTLPLLLYLRSERGLRFIDTLAGWCHQRGGIFLFLIPLLLVRIAFFSVFKGWNSWAEFFDYTVFFVIGFIVAADPRFTQSIKKHGWMCLLAGLVGFITDILILVKLDYNLYGEPFSWKFLLFQTVYGISRWSWIVFVLSLGARYLNFNNRALAYGNEAVLPFYILHEPIIALVGWFVISLNIGILPKYLIISLAAFSLIMVLYDLIVRRFNVIRFLFGMRPQKEQPSVPARPESAAA